MNVCQYCYNAQSFRASRAGGATSPSRTHPLPEPPPPFLNSSIHPCSCLDAYRMSELALESTEGLLIRPTQTDHQDQSNTHCSKITKFLVGTLLFSIVITCTVLSKLSLISLVSRFNKTIDSINSVNNSEALQLSLHNRAAGIFWQLLFIILIPQFVTFFRALLFGVCGKQSRTFPWPTPRAILTVSGQLPISALSRRACARRECTMGLRKRCMVSDMHVRELHAGTFFSLHPHVRMYILELQGILVCYETNNCIQTYIACIPSLLYDAGFFF